MSCNADSNCDHDHHGHDDVDGYDFDAMDPCCQKEAMLQLRRETLMTKLHAADRVAEAERRKRSVFANVISEENLPIPGDYAALAQARQRQAESHSAAVSSQSGSAWAGEGCTELHAHAREDDSSDHGSSDSDYEDLLNDLAPDSELTRIQDEQRQALQQQQTRYFEQLATHGFGLHIEISDPQELASIIQSFPRIVVHTYNAGAYLSGQLDLLLEAAAQRYLGTRFIRLPSRAVSSGTRAAVTANRYSTNDSNSSSSMRSGAGLLDAYKDGAMIARVDASSQFADGDNIESAALEQWLNYTGALQAAPMPLQAMEHISKSAASNDRSARQHNLAAAAAVSAERSDSDAGDSERAGFDCGKAGCNKSFAHQHVEGNAPVQGGLLAPGMRTI